MKNVAAADAPYRRALLESADLLEHAFAACTALPIGSSDDQPFTEAIALRMQAWYHLQRRIQGFLPKDLSAPGSDAFVEAVAFFLKVWLQQRAPRLHVAAERRAGRLRPDVSVFYGEALVAVIECKTNLGRSRLEWDGDFLERELELSSLPSRPAVFLLVLTARNWDGFGDDPRSGLQLFTLLREWPSDIPLEKSPVGSVIHPVEPLFRTIAALCDDA